MQQAVDAATSRRRFQTTLLIIFALTSLVLALIGLYGLLAYSVRQRVAEIGVRIALGASRPRVITMVMRQGACGWCSLCFGEKPSFHERHIHGSKKLRRHVVSNCELVFTIARTIHPERGHASRIAKGHDVIHARGAHAGSRSDAVHEAFVVGQLVLRAGIPGAWAIWQ